MFGENSVGVSKPFNSLTDEEKIEYLHRHNNEIFSRLASLNDLLRVSDNEVMFWRRLFAMKEGLTTEQVSQLFNERKGLPGLERPY